MRPLAIFLVGVLIAFGLVAALIIVSRPTERVFVVVDDSFPMRGVWSQVRSALDEIESEGYAEYALATEKGLVHSWQGSLELRAQAPYAPCDFGAIGIPAEAGEADERVLITTAGSCPTDGLLDWRVVTLSR